MLPPFARAQKREQPSSASQENRADKSTPTITITSEPASTEASEKPVLVPKLAPANEPEIVPSAGEPEINELSGLTNKPDADQSLQTAKAPDSHAKSVEEDTDAKVLSNAEISVTKIMEAKEPENAVALEIPPPAVNDDNINLEPAPEEPTAENDEPVHPISLQTENEDNEIKQGNMSVSAVKVEDSKKISQPSNAFMPSFGENGATPNEAPLAEVLTTTETTNKDVCDPQGNQSNEQEELFFTDKESLSGTESQNEIATLVTEEKTPAGALADVKMKAQEKSETQEVKAAAEEFFDASEEFSDSVTPTVNTRERFPGTFQHFLK